MHSCLKACPPAVLLSISSLLTDANPDDPLVPDAATMFHPRPACPRLKHLTLFACTATTAHYSIKRPSNGPKSTRNSGPCCWLRKPAAACALPVKRSSSCWVMYHAYQ